MKKTSNANRPTNTRAVQKKSSGGTLIGVFVGLVVGLGIAFGVVWFMNKSPLPFQNKFEGAPKAEGEKGEKSAPAPLPGKPGDKASDKTAEKTGEKRFEFYDILEGKPTAKAPGNAAPPPTTAPAAPPPAPPAPPAATAKVPATPAPPPGASPTQAPAPVADAKPAVAVEAKATSNDIYFLQAGAFAKASDADNLKAKLAISGMDAGVKEVNVPEKGTMHRVRVGPFRSIEEMTRARNQLSQNGIQATVVKIKE